jgi:integrase/recombinase XerD
MAAAGRQVHTEAAPRNSTPLETVREAIDLMYQFKREPLTQDEATRLANACQSHPEKLVIWTLLDTGLRVSELAMLTKEHIEWQGHRLMIYGKGGPYGSQTKRRIIPLSPRVQPLIEGHFALHDTLGMAPRTIQVLVKRVASRARIRRPVTPHVLRHTFAVTAVQKGISLPALQRLLGHDRLTTTEIYLNLSPEEVVREFREKW